MRVAVLGTNSFAGSDFVDLLLATGDHDVLGISRSPQKAPALVAYARRPLDRFAFRQLDINDDLPELIEALDEFAPDWIINFAAQGDDVASWSYPQDFLRTNCVALAGLVDRLKERPYPKRFLHVSSSSVYGNTPGTVTEATPLAPVSPYGVSKVAADLLLLAYYAQFGFPVQIVRPPNIYGPYQPVFRIIPKTVISLRQGKRIELHGGGYAKRAYLHVRDASRAMLVLLEGGAAGTVYNISPDGIERIRDIVETTCAVLGKDFAASTIEVEDRRSQPSVGIFDSSKIRADLGWHAETSLREGIEGIVAWIERDWNELTGESLQYVHAR